MYASSLGAQHHRSRVRMPETFPLYPVCLREAGYYCTNNSKTDYNLANAGQPWQVIYGQGNTRCQNALNTIDSIAKTHHLTLARVENDAENGPKARWGWSCEKCGDADCEHRLFTSLVSDPAAPR